METTPKFIPPSASTASVPTPDPAIVELRALLTQNLAATQSIETRLATIQRWIFWQRVWGWIKLALIIVPLVLGALYLPRIIQDMIAPYQQLLQSSGNGSYLDIFLKR